MSAYPLFLNGSINTAVIDVAIDAAIDPDRPASANNFNDGAIIDRP